MEYVGGVQLQEGFKSKPSALIGPLKGEEGEMNKSDLSHILLEIKIKFLPSPALNEIPLLQTMTKRLTAVLCDRCS